MTCKLVNDQVRKSSFKSRWILLHHPNWHERLSESEDQDQLFLGLLDEPVLFLLVRKTNSAANIWGKFAADRGFGRSIAILAKNQGLDVSTATAFVRLAIKQQDFEGLKGFISQISSKIPMSTYTEWAKQTIDAFCAEPDICTQILLHISTHLSHEQVTMFFSFCILSAIRSSDTASIVTHLLPAAKLKVSQLELDWSELSEPSFHLILAAAIGAEEIAFLLEYVENEMLETIFSKDYANCLSLLFQAGLVLEDASALRTVTVQNSWKCAQVLIGSGMDPHVDNDACFIEAASLGHTRILFILSKFWSPALAQKVLYIAVEGDKVSLVEMLLKLPKVVCDQQALTLAMHPSRGVRNESGKSCLEVLMNSSKEINEVTNISKRALQNVSEFVSKSLNHAE